MLVFQLQLKHSIRGNVNQYNPGLFDVRLNVCDLGLETNKFSFSRFFFEKAVPEWKERYGHLLHGCPYQV
jgi:hypothetical protein